ncbi:hypothetical protein BO78DRAFT_69807 [Aspergillus sclerotiicarbonarius CBS 121057]|uniref:Uncharacterized protein n=1 Tax=Aspergillus sclerotiicarbonarius (strain CBS 121057 / IBT 28362) TaxID=1448318 RepID=A0A319F2N6_ASPSB|nr:hypothetical protein BO78DRAFT_69807 [Aspergillus sclerotiicarbonarius CBS 121057]
MFPSFLLPLSDLLLSTQPPPCRLIWNPLFCPSAIEPPVDHPVSHPRLVTSNRATALICRAPRREAETPANPFQPSPAIASSASGADLPFGHSQLTFALRLRLFFLIGTSARSPYLLSSSFSLFSRTHLS